MVQGNPKNPFGEEMPGKDWSEIGQRILDVARVATAVHLARVALEAASGGAAEETPRVTQGG